MRANQKARTRQAIVRAAGALLAKGAKPSLDEIAEEAKVSRATAYRYFPGLDALLSEAAVDWDAEQAVVRALWRAHSFAGEDDALAVGRPSAHAVGAGVEREPFRFAARRGDV